MDAAFDFCAKRSPKSFNGEMCFILFRQRQISDNNCKVSRL